MPSPSVQQNHKLTSTEESYVRGEETVVWKTGEMGILTILQSGYGTGKQKEKNSNTEQRHLNFNRLQKLIRGRGKSDKLESTFVT